MLDVQKDLTVAALAIIGIRGEIRSAAAEHVFEDGVCLSCADDQPDGPLDEPSQVLLTAISELDHATRSAFDPSVHPRNPKGSAGGGRFRSNVDRLKDALKAHKSAGGKGDPFEGFDREQLRRVAKARGIELKRGEVRDSIAKKLMAHLNKDEPKADTPKAEEPKKPPRAPRKAKPKKPQVSSRQPKEPAAASRGSVGGGRDIFADVAESVRRDGSGNRYDKLQHEFGEYDPRDGVLTELTRQQGFGLPAVGSVDGAVADGSVELFRGVFSRPGVSAADQIAAMRDDPGFAYGSGIYGNGIYFSVERRVAEGFAKQAPEGETGATVRVAIRPDARIITLAKLEADRKAWLREHRGDIPPAMEDWLFDDGRYAAMFGYDAIRIDGMEDGFVDYSGGTKGRRSKATQYVVLNRGALTMEAG